MAAVLYIHNSPATILHLAVVRRLNNFSAHTDPTKNRILKNWSQSCGIRCHLCWGWGEEIDCSCVRGTGSVFLLSLLFLVLMCIYSTAVLFRSWVSNC